MFSLLKGLLGKNRAGQSREKSDASVWKRERDNRKATGRSEAKSKLQTPPFSLAPTWQNHNCSNQATVRLLNAFGAKCWFRAASLATKELKKSSLTSLLSISPSSGRFHFGKATSVLFCCSSWKETWFSPALPYYQLFHDARRSAFTALWLLIFPPSNQGRKKMGRNKLYSRNNPKKLSSSSLAAKTSIFKIFTR